MTVTPIATQITALQKQLALLEAHVAPKVILSGVARASAPLTWDFTAAKTVFSDGAKLDNIAWNFTQGTFKSTTSLLAPGYVFAKAGSYKITATVTDSWGATTSGSITITVKAPVVVPPKPVSLAFGAGAFGAGVYPGTPVSPGKVVPSAKLFTTEAPFPSTTAFPSPS